MSAVTLSLRPKVSPPPVLTTGLSRFLGATPLALCPNVSFLRRAPAVDLIWAPLALILAPPMRRRVAPRRSRPPPIVLAPLLRKIVPRRLLVGCLDAPRLLAIPLSSPILTPMLPVSAPIARLVLKALRPAAVLTASIATECLLSGLANLVR